MVAKKKPKMTSQLVKRLLRERFDDSRRYAIAEEVGNATGMEQSRRMDMVVCDCYKSNRFAIEGIEVKVSKSDLRRELEDSSKHNIFYPALTYYSLAAPADIIDIDMLPPKWGVYAVYTFDDKPPILRAMRKPLDLHDEEVESISKPFAMCLMRAIACQSPTHAQLRDARQEGYDAGYQAAERQFESRRTRDGHDYEVLEELSRMCCVWGKGDVERGIKEFNAAMRLNTPHVRYALKRAMKASTEALEVLDTMTEGGEE